MKCSDLGVASDRYKLSYESAADTVSSHVSELYVGRERFTIADRNQFIEVVFDALYFQDEVTPQLWNRSRRPGKTGGGICQ